MFQLGRKQTPAKWVAAQRIERAAHLLRTTRLPVQQVAEESGIPDPFQFSRFFKRHTGHSPRAYRIRQGIL
jgi:AraC family transcriptional regulator